MKKSAKRLCNKICYFIILVLLSTTVIQANDDPNLNKKIELAKNKGTVYSLLQEITDKSDYMFIYDSNTIDNNKKINIPKGEHSIRETIDYITRDKNLIIKVIGSHILIQLPLPQEEEKIFQKAAIENDNVTKNKNSVLKGSIYDESTNKPLPFSSLGVLNSSIGTVANEEGEFSLIVPDSLLNSQIKITYLGFQSKLIEASLWGHKNVRFYLKPQIVSLQDIIINPIDPYVILEKMKKNIDQNYSQIPVLLTVFYREGVKYKKDNAELTESLLNIYKSGYKINSAADQAKMIKMRRTVNRVIDETAYTSVKIKSGISTCSNLDIIKEFPHFINPSEGNAYEYKHSAISYIDGRRVNVISFEQKKEIKAPLYKGKLFIDSENYALVEIKFELNPSHIKNATAMFVNRKHKDIALEAQKVVYSVSYKQAQNGYYYINHIRGDLKFKMKNKKWIFNSSYPLQVWFEMVNCKTETENITRFNKTEQINPNDIISDIKHTFDKNFWGSFNTILPEEDLKKFIVNNLPDTSEK